VHLRICKAANSQKGKERSDDINVCVRLLAQHPSSCLERRAVVVSAAAGKVILTRLDRYGQNSRSRKELVQYLNPFGWVMSI
jgi:hypothetical protein